MLIYNFDLDFKMSNITGEDIRKNKSQNQCTHNIAMILTFDF
jgi:hypothetical protein